MQTIMDVDNLEAFVLDFLAYRRELRRRAVPRKPIAKEVPMQMLPKLPKQNVKIPPAIGRGWPHYRGLVNQDETKESDSANPFGSLYEDIISDLSPIVLEMVNQFDPLDNPSDLSHVTNQVIAKAMTIPAVSESMRLGEMSSWGRAPLIYAVAELMIKLKILERTLHGQTQ